MKLLHVADLHFGMATHSWPDPMTGLPSRLVDVARCWRFLCERAVEAEVDAVVCAGDIFHTASPDAASLVLFADELNLLRSNGIPLLLVPGNHDRAPYPNRPCVLEAFQNDLVTVATRPTVVEVGGIEFACLPSVSRHQLMAPEYMGTKWVLEADEDLVDGLRRVIAGALAPVGGDVLVGHYSVSGCVLGGETDIAIIPEPMLAPADLEGPWSYAAFGHIHRAQPIETGYRMESGEPIARVVGAYAGSIDRMNFGEETYMPGAWIVEIEAGGSITLDFIETPARRFQTIEYSEDLLADENVTRSEGAIVRVRNVPEARAHEVRRLLEANAVGAALVRIEIAKEERPPVRAAEITEAPGPIDALDVWFDHRQIEEDVRPRVRDRARELVEVAT